MTDPRPQPPPEPEDACTSFDAQADAEPSHRVTRLISQAQAGHPGASDQLLPLVYDELKRLAAAHLAREPSGITLQPTALVHEVYLRLLGGSDIQWQGKGHFFAAAAQAMRRILVDRARARAALKRGGDRRRDDHAIDSLSAPLQTPGGTTENIDLLRLNRALERLESRDQRQSEVVLLRYFAGLTIEQTAQALSLSIGTVKNEWTFAKAWLRRELENAGADDPSP